MRKTPPNLSLFLASIAASVALSGRLSGQQTWDGNSGSNYNWSTGANWASGTAPASSTTNSNTATFDNTTLSGDRVPNLDSDRAIGGLIFGGTGYTLDSTGGSTLTIGGGRIIGNTAGTNTINHNTTAVTSTSGTNTYATLSNGSNLALNGTTTFDFSSSDTGIRIGSFNVGASSTLTIGGTIFLNNTSAATDIRFNKGGDGTLQLNFANAFTGFGRATLTAGTISVSANNAMGSILIVSVAGNASNKAVLINTGGVTIGNQIQFLNGNATATGNITTHTIGGTNTSGTVTFDSGATALDLSNAYADTSATTLQKLTQFTAASGGRVEFKSVIRDNGTALRTGGINKVGAGTVALYGANTYTLGTVVTGGALLVNNLTGSGTGAGNVSVGAGAILGGTGAISGSVSVAGSLNAGDGGNARETLGIGGALDLSLAQTTTFDLAGTTRGSGYDGIDVTGALVNGGTLALNFTTAFLAGGETFDLFALSGGQSGDFSSILLAGAYTGTLSNTSGVWAGADAGNNYTFTYTQVSGDLVISGVPEPSAGLLLVAGFGLLGLNGRLRKTATV